MKDRIVNGRFHTPNVVESEVNKPDKNVKEMDECSDIRFQLGGRRWVHRRDCEKNRTKR